MMMLETVIDDTGQEVCLPCTSGGGNAAAVLSGNGKALGYELFYMAERSLLIGLGLYLAGFRKERWVRGTVAATLAMEAFVFGYVLVQKGRQQ